MSSSDEEEEEEEERKEELEREIPLPTKSAVVDSIPEQEDEEDEVLLNSINLHNLFKRNTNFLF